jgi:hypothetical protein
MIRRLIRATLALPLLVIAIAAVSGVAHVGPAATLCAEAGFTHRAGLVVEHGDRQVVRRCVGFNTSTTTALGLLQTSGLEIGLSSYGGGLGAAVCQIDNEPATYPPGCFSGASSYWVLFVSRGGGPWANSALGASSVAVSDGDDIGFRYDSQTGADPSPPSPAGTCPVATPSPVPTPATPGRETPPPHTPPSAAHATATPARPSSSTPATTPTAGVLGLVTPAATHAPVGSLSPPGDAPGFSIGLLLAAIAVGALVGLLGVRALRRPRA